MSLYGEGGAAAARGRGVGVVDLEIRADQIIGIVYRCTLHIREGDVVNDDPRAVAFKHLVIRCDGVIKGEFVREPLTPAAIHKDTEF